MQVVSHDSKVYGDGIHFDALIQLSKAETDWAGSDGHKAIFSAIALTWFGEAAPFAIAAFDQKADEIKSQAGPNGCQLNITVTSVGIVKQFQIIPI